MQSYKMSKFRGTFQKKPFFSENDHFQYLKIVYYAGGNLSLGCKTKHYSYPTFIYSKILSTKSVKNVWDQILGVFWTKFEICCHFSRNLRILMRFFLYDYGRG